MIEKRPDGAWGVASMHDYPVQETKLRGVLTGLTELRLTEPRTTDPAQFSRLGVDDPNGAGSTADLLRVVDAAGKPILAVIVGHRRVRSQANVPEEVYVRRPDENQSWLAEGSLQVDADPSLWLDRDIMNIGHDRIASVVGRRQGAGVRPGGRQVHPDRSRRSIRSWKTTRWTMSAARWRLLTFQEVKADADAPGTEAGHAVFTTDDGLAVTVTVFHADKDVWARFAVAAIVRQGEGGGRPAERAAGRLDVSDRLLEGEIAGAHDGRPEGGGAAAAPQAASRLRRLWCRLRQRRSRRRQRPMAARHRRPPPQRTTPRPRRTTLARARPKPASRLRRRLKPASKKIKKYEDAPYDAAPSEGTHMAAPASGAVRGRTPPRPKRAKRPRRLMRRQAEGRSARSRHSGPRQRPDRRAGRRRR